MSYLNFIKEALGEHFDHIVEEVGYIGNNREPNTLTIRRFVGTNYKSSTVVPIQLEIITDDVHEKMKLLEDFAKQFTTVTISSGLDYIKQNYATPRLDQAFIDGGHELLNIISLNGTLVITSDIEDIEKIIIDGEEIYFDNVEESYVALTDSPKSVESWLHGTVVRGGINKIIITSLAQNTMLSSKIKSIKKGASGNVKFEVEIHEKNNGDVMKYTMTLDSMTKISNSANIPFVTMSFTE